jgi:hypothetical protein
LEDVAAAAAAAAAAATDMMRVDAIDLECAVQRKKEFF